MPSQSAPQPEGLAKAIAVAAEELTSYAKDDLLRAAEALRDSGIDLERLIRLSKLSAKAAELRGMGPGYKAYHY